MNLRELVEFLEDEFGDCVNINIVDLRKETNEDEASDNNKNDREELFEKCFEYLEEVSPSDDFAEELTNILVTLENVVQDIKKYGTKPPETYLNVVNDMLNDILEHGSYTIKLSLK